MKSLPELVAANRAADQRARAAKATPPPRSEYVAGLGDGLQLAVDVLDAAVGRARGRAAFTNPGPDRLAAEAVKDTLIDLAGRLRARREEARP